MKIFVATPLLPKPDTSAGDRRFFAILEMLCRQNEVTLLILDPLAHLKSEESYFIRLERIGVRNIICGEKLMRRVMLKQKFDLGLFEFFSSAEQLGHLFRAAQPDIPVIVDSVDIHYLREAGSVKLGRLTPDQAEINKKRELKLYQDASGVIVITKDEEAVLRQELPEIKTWLIPIIVPLLERRNIPRKNTVLFVGGFKHHPNVDGILWFVNEVWPQIRLKITDVELLIVGSDPTEQITALNGQNGIKVTGFVPDTTPYLDQAAVSIAPLRYGAGMKGKVSEALAAGMAVVTTSFGVQGFSAISGEHLFVANEPQEFAENAVYLLKHPAEALAMGKRGRDLVKGICSIEAVTAKVQTMMEEVMPSRNESPTVGDARDGVPIKNPKVSIIIPTYRHRDFILHTLGSVFAQTMQDYEIIVVNDGSPDDTKTVLAPLIQANYLKYFEQKNQGQSIARNEGIKLARGEYIAFLDDDDVWPEDKLEWQTAFLDSRPDVALVGGVLKTMDEHGNVGDKGNFNAVISFESLFAENPFLSPGQTLIRADVLKELGGMSANIWGADDWDLLFRIARKNKIVMLDRLALYYRVHPGNASKQIGRLIKGACVTVETHLKAMPRTQRRTLRHTAHRMLYRGLGTLLVTNAKKQLRRGRLLRAVKSLSGLLPLRHGVFGDRALRAQICDEVLLSPFKRRFRK